MEMSKFKVTNIYKTARGFRIETDAFPGKYFPVKPEPLFEAMYADFMEGTKIEVTIDSIIGAPAFTREKV